MHELSYRARSWTRARRVILVVQELPGEQPQLFLHHFFLLTNVPVEEARAEELLERYRKRGTAEKEFGDWNSALNLSLSSAPRPKSHYREQPIQQRSHETDSFGANEVRLLLSLIAANLLHAGAALLERDEKARMSRERFRTLVLKSAARVTLSERRVRVIIEAARAPLWQAFRDALDALYPVRGSPQSRALPQPG